MSDQSCKIQFVKAKGGNIRFVKAKVACTWHVCMNVRTHILVHTHANSSNLLWLAGLHRHVDRRPGEQHP